MNKKAVLFFSTALLLTAPALLAAEKELTPQQQRMKDCNAEAKKKELAADARQEFMSKCLKGETVASAAGGATTQQDKMKSCNEQAGKKKLAGDERKKFMSECLSAKSADDTADKKSETKKDDKAMTQQDRMKSCNEQAGKKKLAGDERKKFMSECLSAG